MATKNNIGAWLAQQLMKDFGLSPGAAAGFAGNLAHESGDFQQMQELNPTIPGSRGGFGWAQWTGPRRRQFENFAKAKGLDPTSADANYGFLKYELTNTPEGRILRDLQGVDDPAQAAQIVSNKFLRPGVPHMRSRVNKANQIAGSMGSPVSEAVMQQQPVVARPGKPAPRLPSPINVARNVVMGPQTAFQQITQRIFGQTNPVADIAATGGINKSLLGDEVNISSSRGGSGGLPQAPQAELPQVAPIQDEAEAYLVAPMTELAQRQKLIAQRQAERKAKMKPQIKI